MTILEKIKFIDFKPELPIESIIIDEEINVRKKIEVGLEELKNSIRQVSLLEPLIVSDEGGGKYKLIAGRRRLEACKQLQDIKTVPARIIEHVDSKIAKILSFSENLQRKQLTTEELKDAAKVLFEEYKEKDTEERLNLIAEDLGIPLYNVISYLKEDAVPKEILVLVKEGKLNDKKAWQVMAALLGDIQKAVDLCKKMADEHMTNPERSSIIETAKKYPSASTTEIINKSRERGTVRINLHLDTEMWIKLNKQSLVVGYESGQDLIKKLIEEYLKNEGLV